jgi:hypothetical protein
MIGPSTKQRWFWLTVVVGAVSSWGAVSFAQPSFVPMDKVKPGTIRINGVLKEWSTPGIALKNKVRGGNIGRNDFRAQVALAYDDDHVYVGAEITDDKLYRTASYGKEEDHCSLVFAFPTASGGYQEQKVELFPGDPGKLAGKVTKGGQAVSGASLVEAPVSKPKGYSFEAKIPWSTFSHARNVRAGLRGNIVCFDSDGGSVKSALSWAGSTSRSWPFVLNEAEQSMQDNLVKGKGLTGSPKFDLVADVTGDSMAERVLVWGKYLVVLGPHFRSGSEFYFQELNSTADDVKSLQVRDVTGDGKAEVLVQMRVGGVSTWRELLSVQTVVSDQLQPILEHEVAVGTTQGTVHNRAAWSTGTKKGMRWTLRPGTAEGLTAANYQAPPGTGKAEVLLPWGTIKSKVYEWDGSRFDKTKEEKQAGGKSSSKPAKVQRPPPPPPPRPPTADEMQNQVLKLYRKDRHIAASAKPKFDLATNVADDQTIERLLVFGKDLVVFGKGYRQGSGYVSISMGFESDKDVIDVTTRDLTGDGRAEILVRGIQKVKAPKELGKGILQRQVLLVYTVQSDKIVRVFSAELGMMLQKNRLSGSISFVPSANSLDLELGPGHSVGWDKKTWPFKQDSEAVGGIEPMILPWTSGRVRYHWNGTKFDK